jgi:sporadic carbohydrate cluster 2OG-Fe(II) oxygenase
MDFLSKNEKILEKEFIEKGFIIREAANKDALNKIQKFVIDMLTSKGGDSLDHAHKNISISELNDFRLDVINELNAQPWLREAYFNLAKPYLDILVGNELAMQKNVNLSIQCPNDDSSLLPIHSDTWDGNSPFEAVLWVPFVDCSKTKSMFILNAQKYNKFEKAYKKKEVKSANDLYKNLKPHIEFVKIKHGEFMLFNQNLPHGNIINKSNETRISLNCRFKSLFTPYRQKELGSFFKPLIIRPASRIGLKYKFPEK